MKIKGRPKGALDGDFIRMSVMIICLFGSFIFVLGQTQNPSVSVPAGKRLPVDEAKVRKFILQHNNQDMDKFSYDQLQKWFENKSAEYKFHPWEYPRAFPFCVTRNQIIQGHKNRMDQTVHNMNKPLRVPANSKLFLFERVFRAIEYRKKKYYQFDAKLDSIKLNKTFVKAISFSRINSPEPDMANMRQWVHVKIEMADRMEGLYLQTIVGPFGLPMGEFSVEFPCKDDPNTSDMEDVGELAYCSYRPRTNIYHPSVYAGADKKNGGRKVWDVHYKWFDLACMETPYVQFLMLIVKKFSANPRYGIDYIAQMSEVFLNTDFDSRDGSPYPYYPGFRDNMFCFIKSNTELEQKYKSIKKNPSSKKTADGKWAAQKWVVAVNVTRIQPNEEYDDCILLDKSVKTDRNTSFIKQNETTYECGPGPLRCDLDYTTIDTRITEFRTKMVENETEVDKCFPCGVPECVKIGFNPELCNVELPRVEDLTIELESLTKLDDNFRIRNHGVGGMLSFLFLIPVGNFIGRFYKEILGRCLFGNGPWIFTHIVCNLLAIAAIWSSMGPMVPKLAGFRHRQRTCKIILNTTIMSGADWEYCMKDYVVKTAHTIIGLIAYILVHFVPIFGFIRPASNKLRFIMSTIHSCLGYLTYVLGVVTVYTAIIKKDTCLDTVIFATIMILLPIIFSVVLFVLDNMSDKIIGVTPPRKQFPVLEQLQLESIGPFSFVKLIVLAVFGGLMTVTWLLALLSLHIVAGSGDALIEGGQSFKGKKGKFLKGLQGIFGSCGSSNASAKSSAKSSATN